MAQKKILLVEDELAIREMMKFAFYKSDYTLLEAEDAEQAQVMIMKEHPDLILLDWMLPGISGLELAQRLKKDSSSKEIPIIMLTARGEENDRVRGLDAGADDYVTKPFSPRELMARIKAVLRRTTPDEDGILELGGIRMDSAKHRLSVADNKFDLGPTEYKLLHFFMTHPERVYDRSQLLDRVWGGDVYIEERTVDVHIRRLRKVLSEFKVEHLIQTVRGAGYRFSTE
ncbi:phosphate regulon transcriptional regulator PhoB [sulfur-oxidizing endosymbiont of Gigantopelta aegis]|uniref:phosphate regulon transcriptional regulator PhoB n=1 Tax=sulfur-oxidizing endosymbiont of Gigantopelta aegis TaxID=2794934 RepID=UPI0018DB2F49|nr:phosphate regulon transcriptional regulator PhoB [sulfur-oxidizing endosymbiont of Gigantopelta aegis]